MKINLFAVLLSGLLLAPMLTWAQADRVLGVWLNEEKDGHIEVFKKNDRYFGKLIWLKEPNNANGQPRLDDQNPDKSLRNRRIFGMTFMENFAYEDGEWVNGSIYDARAGKTYKCKMKLRNATTLDVRGYIGAAWMGLGKTTIWTKIQ